MNDHRPSEIRLKCRAVGCDGSPYCNRCGTDLYDPSYIQRGFLDPLASLYWRVRRWVGNRRCGVDGCLLKPGHEGSHDDIPF